LELAELQNLITLDEVAEYLRVETAVVERAAQEGQLLAYRIGAQYRTTWDAVQAYLRANATAPDSGRGGVSRTPNPVAYRTASSPPGGKYWRIGELLAGEREPCVTYSIARLEQEIGRKLPRSAREYRAWWSNATTSHPHAQSWLSRGWRVVAVDLAREEVTFEQVLTRRS
jgi:excisionase family DNA binding protein